MPKIQTVLASGGTSPKDFTLHDAGHSFRVAQRMAEIARASLPILSSFELSLLLLSAYLHDIGMTPELKKVQAHNNHLLTGEKADLTGEDIEQLQKWLDDEGYVIVPPISDSIPPSNRLALASQLTAYYCRHRHNDWSGEWIRKNLAGEQLGNYRGWINDLVLLCKSHHFGYDSLKQDAFKARDVGSPPAVVNLRYLAMILRVADILEFDPERTPEVIFQHRDIAQESRIYWWKDQELSVRLEPHKVVVTARPSSARVHKAIEDTIDAIDSELAQCQALVDESLVGAAKPYQWDWLPKVHRDLAPRDETYEYIDGAFRPDTKKLLSILSGTSLYKDPLEAVRELVQNAFDAVWELMAHQRLAQPNPASTELAARLAANYRVSLGLELNGEEACLVCVDNGVGMSKAIIRDRVLVSGSGPRHDIRALERKCRDAGFELGRSGQFGIGILSYFMLAKRVEIETQRAQDPGDSDNTPWHFESDGIGSFGELRKADKRRHGTEVRLTLRPEIAADWTEWYRKLRRYLAYTLIYCPCEFRLGSTFPGCEPLERGVGWCSPDPAEALSGLRDAANRNRPSGELLSNAELNRRSVFDRDLKEVEAECSSRIRWYSSEGSLSHGAGHFVVRIPYFELEGGVSAAFLRTALSKNGLAVRPFLDGNCYLPKSRLQVAWKGMAVQSEVEWRSNAFCWVNLVSETAGAPMASRETLRTSEEEPWWQAEIETHAEQSITQFLHEFRSSEYAWLNARLLQPASCAGLEPRWLSKVEPGGQGPDSVPADTPMLWKPVRFPAIGALMHTAIDGDTEMELNGRKLAVPSWLRLVGRRAAVLPWSPLTLAPDRIVSYSGSPVPLWLRKPADKSSLPWLQCAFPAEWHHLVGCQILEYGVVLANESFWNSGHPAVRHLTPEAWQWCSRELPESSDPRGHRELLLSDAAKGAAWLLQRMLAGERAAIFEALFDQDPEFLPRLFKLLLGPKGAAHRIAFWRLDKVHIFGPRDCVEADDPRTMKRYLPPPSADWVLTPAKQTRARRTRR